MEERIYHTFLAGWCAEAAGARLEFQKRRFSAEEVQKRRFSAEEVADAMHMTGETSTGIYPGQITDDSELEIALLSALVEERDSEYFPLEAIAQKYIQWYHSNPFDIGQTTTFALMESENAEDMLTNAHLYNENSESNGSLMRCVPLAIFGKDPAIVRQMAAMESELTHPAPIVGQITGLYCVLLAQLLAKKEGDTFDFGHLIDAEENEQIRQWYNEGQSLLDLKTYNCISNEGHVKHAFVFVVYFLKHIHEYTYEQAIAEVLECGGDTDTNAKIVGNLFGAYYGDCVPTYMSDIVLQFDCTSVDEICFRRPFSCSVQYALQLLKKNELKIPKQRTG